MKIGIKIRKKSHREIAPDEIFIDSHNLPQFDTQQFEGRLERPISRTTLSVIVAFFVLVLITFGSKVWALQIKDGDIYRDRSENNRLRHTPIFAARGVIYDRNGVELAWNAPSDDPDIALRKYKGDPGLAHVVGYVQYPSKDSAGFYYREDFEGADGAEKHFNSNLQGANGIKLVEVDARGKVQSQNTMQPPKEGSNLSLSIDSRIQSEMYRAIRDIAGKVGFSGGAGVMMDVTNGEIIAMTSYPEYDSETMSSKTDTAKVKSYLTSPDKPFLDRAVDGLYTPGSIIKPYMALAALNEKVINASQEILSTGSIAVQNQYYPDLQTIFKDWKAHGYVDMRHAIAVSSDVYFYEIGGGYKDQKGLGIARIEKYMKQFGFGEKISDSFFTGAAGTVPNPEWKKEHFDGEAWNLGNTYHTSIGQYGFQTSPIQIVRALASIVNDGLLRNPSIIKGELGPIVRQIDIPADYFTVIKEGMRLGVQQGTGTSLNVPYVEIASKSGTAELGASKDKVNSWMTGYFPYKAPRYAFAVLMEKGSVHNLIGAGAAMREVLDWMNINTPEYFK
ncbi:MAG: penicillin-binding transpeptidase domain-containing protein [Patescibacteria group bacterium]